MTWSEYPRIYTSFADFEREECRRLGLPEPAIVEPVPVTIVMPPPAIVVLRSTKGVSPTSLRSEGVLEIGCATGTSVLFVRTKVKLHLLHSTWLPDRMLDDYAVSLAVVWIEEHGLPSYEVARNLGVSDNTLRRALVAAGYARLSLAQHEQLARAREGRKLGNRRGRLVRASGEKEGARA